MHRQYRLLFVIALFALTFTSINCKPLERTSDSGSVPCQDNSACGDDDNFCNGDEVCVGSSCQHTGDPCIAENLLCDASRSLCVACLGDDDCSHGERCDETERVCVECTSNSDCDNGNQCDGFESCSHDGKCKPGQAAICEVDQVCEPFSGQCYGCLESSDCSEPTPLCVDNTCAQCSSSKNCNEENPLCVAGTCAQCTDDEDCKHDRKCDMESHMCVRCFDDWDCDNHDKCDGEETCSTDGECLAGTAVTCEQELSCETLSGECVACLEDSDCSDPEAPLCSRTKCVQCILDNDCPNDVPACVEGVCEELKHSLKPTVAVRRQREAKSKH